MNFEDLLSMSLEESEAWLDNIMESEQDLIPVPHYLKDEIETKCQHVLTISKKIQLFMYSAKVCAAVACALILLFSISPAEFTYPFDTRSYETMYQESAITDVTFEELKVNFDKCENNKKDTQEQEVESQKESKLKQFFYKIQVWFQNYKK